MGVIFIATIFGLAVAAGIVQFAVIRSGTFSLRRAGISGVIALLLVSLVATITAYFLTRVHIGDHYEVNSILMITFVCGPAAIGAIVGAVTGGFLAYHALHPRV